VLLSNLKIFNLLRVYVENVLRSQVVLGPCIAVISGGPVLSTLILI
jgi:hypothetical protein